MVEVGKACEVTADGTLRHALKVVTTIKRLHKLLKQKPIDEKEVLFNLLLTDIYAREVCFRLLED